MLEKITKSTSQYLLKMKIFFIGYTILYPNFLYAQDKTISIENNLQASYETLPLIILIFITLLLILFMVSSKMLRIYRKLDKEHLASERLFEMLSIGPDGYYAFIYYPEAVFETYNNENDKLSNYDNKKVKQECSRTLALMLGLSSGLEANFSQTAEKFKDEDRRSLVKYVDDLRRYGNNFSGIFRLYNDEKIFRIKGNRATSSAGRTLCDVIWFRDITEDFEKIDTLEDKLKQAKSSRNMNRAMLDSLNSPVWLRGDDLSIIWCNSAYAKMTDAPTAKEAALKSEELFKGNDARKLRALAARARASREKRTEKMHLIVDGKRKFIEINEIPFNPLDYGIMGEQSQLYTAGIAYDITNIEEIEKKSDLIKKQNDDVWKNINTAVAVFDANANLAFYNYSFINIWKLDEEQLLSQPSYGVFLDLLRDKRLLPETIDYPSYKAAEIRNFSSLIDSKEELLHLSSGITIRRVTAPHYAGGLMMIYEDITDKLAMESSYNTLLAVQNDTIAHLHEAVAVFGVDGKLKLFNPAYSELWNIESSLLDRNPTIGQVIEWQYSFFDNSKTLNEFKEDMLQKLTEKSFKPVKINRNDDITLETNSVPLPDGGILITYVDITDKEKIAKILKDQNNSMKAASRMRSRFLSSVSDEFKEPLSEIMSYAQTLEKQISDTKIKIAKKTKESINKIYENANTLKDNIDNIVDLASIEAGQMPLSLNAFDVNQMLKGVLAMTANKIKKSKIEFTINAPKDIGWIVGDEKRVKQVLYYMIGHTVASSSLESKIELNVKRENYALKGDCIIFCISSVFDKNPYFPEFENDSNSGWYELNGIGDNMVKKFVEQHHGLIEVKNEENNITNVYIVLPTNS
ncbi:MAG: PAS-domain containing protein [Alphaproteobacteria bacterium]